MFMNSSVRRQRDEELTALFLSMLGSGMPAEATMARCADMPCSRFWIEPEHARRLIRRRLEKKKTQSQFKGRHAEKRANNERRVDEIMHRCDGDYSMAKIAEVVYSPAPSFYMSGRTAQAVITRTLKRRRSHGVH